MDRAATSAPIPLLDLAAQYRELREELLAAAARVLDSGAYILGPEGRAFEAEFASAMGVPHCAGVSSGTAGLSLALELCGVAPGDEVVVPAFTFIATASTVAELGAKPVFADVEPGSLTLDPKDLARKLSRRCKAVVPVHLYGYPADMDPLCALAREAGARVVEDCAQAHLALYRGRPVGGLGDAGVFSFYPSKNLGALGDAGALVTRDRALLDGAHMLRDAGREPGSRYRHARVGHNFRLDELQAAFLRVKLRRLAAWDAARRRLAALYRSELAGLPLTLPPEEAALTRHAYHLFVLQTARRDALAERLRGAGIGTGVYYPIPLHLQPAFRGLGHREGDFPQSERASREALALPLYPEMAEEQVRRVCAEARRFFGE